MSETNKCNECGKFKPWEELTSCAGDSDEIGNYDHWFECVDCMRGIDLIDFTKRKINKIAELKAELKQKDEKLSEFIEGIPIEKAKECGDYYCLDLGYCVATYFENGKWYYSDDGPNRNPCEVSNRLYPLPSTETQMEGE